MASDQTAEQFQELLAAARRGDEAAMTELVKTYEPEVRIVARVRLGPALRAHLDSVDLVQSVHRSLMVGLRDQRFELNQPENLVALALTIVRRKVARQWRRLQRQQRLSQMKSPHESGPDLLMALVGGEEDPQDNVALREKVAQLYQSLSPAEQELIELRLTGHSTAEAARLLNRDPDVTRVQLHRLRKRVREAGLFADPL